VGAHLRDIKGLRCQAAKPNGDGPGDAKPLDLGQVPEWLILGPFDDRRFAEDELDKSIIPD